MSDFNQYEYVVSDKQNKSRKWQKVLMILGYVAVDAGLFFCSCRSIRSSSRSWR